MRFRTAYLLSHFLLPLLLCGSFNSIAKASDLPVVGGPGGGAFRLACGRDEFLVGVYVKSGTWIDAIGLKCAPFRGVPSTTGWVEGSFKRPAINTPFFGGQGGGAPREVVCAPDRFVSKLQFGFTINTDGHPMYLDYVQISCKPVGFSTVEVTTLCLETGDGCKGRWLGDFPGGFSVVPPVQQECPISEWASGIRGRHGIYVDALGLVCKRQPEPIVSPAPSPSPRPPRRRVWECTVLQDTDVFTDCCGRGQPTGTFLRQGRRLRQVRTSPEDANWHLLRIDATTGWVFSGPGHVSLQCRFRFTPYGQ